MSGVCGEFVESGSNLRVFPERKPATLRDRKPTLTSMFAGQSRIHSVGLTGFEPATPWRDRANFFKASDSGKFADSLVISRG
jgi:hypothetical protein